MHINYTRVAHAYGGHGVTGDLSPMGYINTLQISNKGIIGLLIVLRKQVVEMDIRHSGKHQVLALGRRYHPRFFS